jgi:hypothetical protein
VRILTVAGAKGGVGKSATAISLASELSRQGYRVALRDMDPQGSATLALGHDPVPDPWEATPFPIEMEDVPERGLILYAGSRSLARADGAGVSRSTLAKYRDGNPEMPTAVRLRFAAFLEAHAEEIRELAIELREDPDA